MLPKPLTCEESSATRPDPEVEHAAQSVVQALRQGTEARPPRTGLLLSDETLRQLLALAVKSFVTEMKHPEDPSGEAADSPPFPADILTRNEALAMASAILHWLQSPATASATPTVRPDTADYSLAGTSAVQKAQRVAAFGIDERQ